MSKTLPACLKRYLVDDDGEDNDDDEDVYDDDVVHADLYIIGAVTKNEHFAQRNLLEPSGTF